MLKKRIIPILQYTDQFSIKTKNFKNPRNIGNLLQYVNVFNKRQSDELCLINLTEKFLNKNFDFNYLKEIATYCNMPLSVGGSINKVYEIENLLLSVTDKIILGKSIINNSLFLKDVIKNFGSQIIIASVDINFNNEEYFLNYNPDIKYQDHIKFLQNEGVGEILINCVHKEGLMNGYDLNLLEKIYNFLEVSILMNGGASKADDFENLLKIDKIKGACVSSIFLFTEETPTSIKKKMPKNLPLRY